VLTEPLRRKLARNPAKAGAAKPKTGPLYDLCQIPDVRAPSWCSIRIPAGSWRMSGGFSFELSQFNRATQAKRQPARRSSRLFT